MGRFYLLVFDSLEDNHTPANEGDSIDVLLSSSVLQLPPFPPILPSPHPHPQKDLLGHWTDKVLAFLIFDNREKVRSRLGSVLEY